uniref:Uncharacterized protein n=1 Tax=Coccidioides posadasii RMSCC 3488 TaxID=454284 RepID=A0A0J6FCR6_COCPO|nr:hypothetical protein CPAG_07153 [Coccidioides posadasii RMSCC 3488]
MELTSELLCEKDTYGGGYACKGGSSELIDGQYISLWNEWGRHFVPTQPHEEPQFLAYSILTVPAFRKRRGSPQLTLAIPVGCNI